MRMTSKSLCFLSLVAVASPANACDKISPTSWLPGYSVDQAWERAEEIWQDWAVIAAYRIEKEMYESASSIYLARVHQAETDDTVSKPSPQNSYRSSVAAEPLYLIRGQLPVDLIQLSAGVTSCDNYTENGEGAYAADGALIIVFEGINPKLSFHGSDIRALKIESLRYVPLMEDVQTWLRVQDGYIPHND